MEPWAVTVIEGTDSESLTVGTGLRKNVPLLRHEEETDADSDEENYDYDPHIWTDPTRAMIMVDNIALYLSSVIQPMPTIILPMQKPTKRAGSIDRGDTGNCVQWVTDKIILGGDSPFSHFVDHYDLEYDAAVDSCSDHSEPSARKIAEIISEIEEETIPLFITKS